MTGKSPMREDYENLGEEVCISVGYFYGFEEFGFGFLVNHCRGTGLLGVLGSGAKNPHGILELGSRIGCS